MSFRYQFVHKPERSHCILVVQNQQWVCLFLKKCCFGLLFVKHMINAKLFHTVVEIYLVLDAAETLDEFASPGSEECGRTRTYTLTLSSDVIFLLFSTVWINCRQWHVFWSPYLILPEACSSLNFVCLIDDALVTQPVRNHRLSFLAQNFVLRIYLSLVSFWEVAFVCNIPFICFVADRAQSSFFSATAPCSRL